MGGQSRRRDSWCWGEGGAGTPRFKHQHKSCGFPGSSAGKESACNAGDLGSIPGLGRSPGEGNGYPLQYSSLENSMDCIVHGAAELGTTFTFTKAVNHDSGA